MRLSDVEICNQAIGLCGSTDWIQTLGDTTSTASMRCDRFFLPAVERVLRRFNWSCATTFVQLAENTTAPTAEYDNAFALPFDCVRVINVYGNSDGYNPHNRWRIVGRDIHTDLTSVYLKYVQFPEDYRDLDVLLSTAISYELATMMAPSLVKDPQIYSILENAKRKAEAEARAIDALENKELYVENDVYNDHRMSIGTNTSYGVDI